MVLTGVRALSHEVVLTGVRALSHEVVLTGVGALSQSMMYKIYPICQTQTSKVISPRVMYKTTFRVLIKWLYTPDCFRFSENWIDFFLIWYTFLDCVSYNRDRVWKCWWCRRTLC